MFSVTYTGINLLPLCTAMVCPTKSGVIIDRLDQVFTTFFLPDSFISMIRFSSLNSTNGPFFSERLIYNQIIRLFLTFLSTLYNVAIGHFLLLPCFVAFSGHTVSGTGDTTGGTSFATAHWM